jgi:hypothetical protein
MRGYVVWGKSAVGVYFTLVMCDKNAKIIYFACVFVREECVFV